MRRLTIGLTSVLLVLSFIFFQTMSRHSVDSAPSQSSELISRGGLDRTSSRLLETADSLRSEADYGQARALYDFARKRLQELKDWEGTAYAITGRARLLGEMGHYADSQTELSELLNQRELISHVSARTLASIHSELGRMLVRLDRFDEAESHLETALLLARSSRQDAEFIEGRALQATGLLYHFQGDYDRALDLYEESYSALSRAAGPGSVDATVPLNNIANIYSRKGEYDVSLPIHQSVLRVREQLLSPNHPLLAVSLGNMGNEFHKSGNYTTAYKMHHQAASIWTLNFGYLHPELAASYNNIGRALNALKKYADAEKFLLRSLQIKLKVLGYHNFRTAITFANLGQTYLHLNRIGDAEEMLGKSIDIWLERRLFRHSGYWSALRDMGLVYARTSRRPQAIETLNRALVYASKSPHPFAVKILNDIAEIELSNSNFEKRLLRINRSIAVNAATAQDPDGSTNPPIYGALDNHELLRSLEMKISVLRKMATRNNDILPLTFALDAAQRASHLVERLLREELPDKSVSELATQASEIYGVSMALAFELYQRSGEPRYSTLAFHFSEKRKSRELIESIADSDARINSGVDTVMIARERAFKLEINLKKRRLAELFTSDAADSLEVATARNELFDSERNYSRFVDALAVSFPEYHALKHSASTISTASVQRDLLDSDTALLEYVVHDSSLVVFVVTEDSIRIQTTRLPSDFGGSVDSLRDAIQLRYDRKYLEYANRLYKILVEPFISNISAINLVIVPEGEIHLVPFEALLVERVSLSESTHNVVRYSELPYLIRERSISYAYSATLLDQTIKRRRDFPTKRLFAIAPAFPAGMSLDSTAIEFLKLSGFDTTDSTFALPPLPGSREEVEHIVEIFRGQEGLVKRYTDSKSTILLHEMATEAAVKSATLSEYRYLHFATHSFASSVDPSLSGMLLRPNRTGIQQDGVLHSGEIFGLRLNAELAVLSACDTGIGVLRGSEGIMGLSRGFIYAGAKNLIVSLWPSDDIGTKYLMIQFYENLASGQDIKTALRNAKLRLISEGGMIARPQFWSPFIQIGM